MIEAPLYMDAVITAHRSLSRRGAIVLICALTAINCVSAGVFVVMGAFAAPVFIALTLLALVLALAVSQRARTNRERVQVTAAEVRVLLESPRGVQTVWTSPTAFTQVDLADGPDAAEDLRLRLSGREVAVARALTRRERLDFAQALDMAIRRARAERMA